jgi:hypothetical protein
MHGVAGLAVAAARVRRDFGVVVPRRRGRLVARHFGVRARPPVATLRVFGRGLKLRRRDQKTRQAGDLLGRLADKVSGEVRALGLAQFTGHGWSVRNSG